LELGEKRMQHACRRVIYVGPENAADVHVNCVQKAVRRLAWVKFLDVIFF
jgi:hypothetical protein